MMGMTTVLQIRLGYIVFKIHGILCIMYGAYTKSAWTSCPSSASFWLCAGSFYPLVNWRLVVYKNRLSNPAQLDFFKPSSFKFWHFEREKYRLSVIKKKCILSMSKPTVVIAPGACPLFEQSKPLQAFEARFYPVTCKFVSNYPRERKHQPPVLTQSICDRMCLYPLIKEGKGIILLMHSLSSPMNEQARRVCERETRRHHCPHIRCQRHSS